MHLHLMKGKAIYAAVLGARTSPTKAERGLDAAFSINLSPTSLRDIWHAYITAGPLIRFVGCFTNLTNYCFFGLACGTQMLCCTQDMTKGLVHLFSIKTS